LKAFRLHRLRDGPERPNHPARSTPKLQPDDYQDHKEMTASPRFLGFPDRLAEGRTPYAVIFGAGHGATYPGKDSSGYALAADAIRAASQDDRARRALGFRSRRPVI
jgi:hypothetical protein